MKKFKNYTELIIGLLLAALSFNLFQSPYNFVYGGVNGLSLIFHKLFGINESLFIIVANLIFLILSFILLGKDTTKKTILGSLLFPLFISLTANINQIIDITSLEKILIVTLGGILSGIGFGLIFRSGYTSGGTDILNQIIEKYFHIPMSKASMITDGLIILSTVFIFDISTLIYSLISLALINTISNNTIIGLGKTKCLYIYTNQFTNIKKYLHDELKIDSTDFSCTGGLTNNKNKLILSVINAKDYYRIKESILLIDPHAFITVTNTYQLKNENITIRS